MEPVNLDAVFAEERIRQVQEAVETWSGQLINLDGRNQLLYYRDLKVGTLELTHSIQPAVDALLEHRTVRLSQLFAEEVLPDRLKRARAIRNKTRELLEERGIATCFLTVGMATWTSTRGTATPAAPVLLQEITIAARGAAEDDFDLALTGEVDVNPALLHLLSTQFGVAVDEEDLLAALPNTRAFTAAPLFERLAKEAADVPGFTVNPRHVVGNFSYAKLPMVNDLAANGEALIAHDLIAAIAGNEGAQARVASSGGPVDPRDVDRIPPADEFLVLDADSSQSFAINAAVAGQSLVVSGPPGTGKSQTIANLIATLVARGESVLFVAEKRAAISAVLERLSRVGLADLVLDLHDGVGSKRKVAENLAAALRAAATVARPDQAALQERLVTNRTRLNLHAEAVNRRRTPWSVSVFEAQCGLLDLDARYGPAASTSLRLSRAELATLDAATFRRVCGDLWEFVSLGGLTLNVEEHPWTGARVFSPEQAEAALGTAQRLGTRTLPETRIAMDLLLQQAGLQPPTTLARWRQLLALLDGVTTTLTVLDAAVFDAPLREMVAATATRTWRRSHRTWPGATAGWGARRKLKKAAAALWQGGQRPRGGQPHGALATALQQYTDWTKVAADGGTPRLPGALSEVHGRYEQLTRELAALGAYLTTELTGQHPAALSTALDRLTRDERTLRKLPRLNTLEAGFQRAGLGPLLGEMRTRRLDAELAVAVVKRCWYASILERIGFDDPVIANFDGTFHTGAVHTFRSADASHISQTTVRVRRAAAERLIAARNEHPQEGRLVETQAARKTKHLPLRQLFSAAPNVMTALKPCWAMSPLVVSQQLPGDRPYFDVVVFDEASQIVPADAVPAILRAKRVIVAGDKHQLPPTSFFSSVSAGDDDGQPVVGEDGSINLALTHGYESILDVLTGALGGGRVRSLTWHYRSHDERLIAFSNSWIYDRSLTTFPGVAGEGCVNHILVDQPAHTAGQEDSVTAEVNRVVELIIDHAATRPAESLGVITMGIKHANRIDEALRRARGQHPHLASFFDENNPERFFVKNLERVQGDERDAIILSIGYGKSPDGRLPYRFGPLLQEGGQRRLNVAVTRARSRMTLISSFSHHDMAPDRSSAPGVKMLRAYLQYASSGGTGLGEAWRDTPALNPFEISVRDRLLAAGVPVTAQYGVAGYWIDFAAAHPTQPGRMVLAVEADGATYHSSTSARDRDRLRQEQLERLGWIFHRIWSTDWFTDPDTCIAKVRLAYDQAVAAADAKTSRQPSPREDWNSDQRSDPANHAPPGLSTPTRGPKPRVPAGLPITVYDDRQLAAVIRWIESDTLLRTEDQLLSEFLATLGFQRRGQRIVEAFHRALSTVRPKR